MSENEKFQPDSQVRLSAHETAMAKAWIHFGEVVIDEGRKIVDWFQQHKGDLTKGDVTEESVRIPRRLTPTDLETIMPDIVAGETELMDEGW